MTTISTRVCVVGCGPAGMMLGLLLARAGIAVTVLEKHADFLRDFRGDTVHPSTLNMLDELGLLEGFLRRPHSEVRRLSARVGDKTFPFADFSHVPGRCKFIALMPQWDFLDFLSDQARAYPRFNLRMSTEATDLLIGDGRTLGVRARDGQGDLSIQAELTVACDGRRSTVREAAKLAVRDLGSPMDVLWLRLPRHPGDPVQTGGYINYGAVFVALERGDYWQCALVIRKGGFEEVKTAGLPALKARIGRIAPDFAAKAQILQSFDEVKLLTVTLDRLDQWTRPGLLCIGDAAHAMSPIGGVGINLAVQDAVAAANILVPALLGNRLTQADLVAVQDRRMFPTQATQAAQALIQNRIIVPTLSAQTAVTPPKALGALERWPWLQGVAAYLVGIGVRPEHIRTPAIPQATSTD